MANQTQKMKVGDTGPAFQVTLRDGDGTAVDVSGSTILFKMRFVQGRASGVQDTLKVNSAATLVDAANGVVEYQWAAGDTDTPGRYLAEFQVTFGSGVIQSYPNPGFNWVEVDGDLDYVGIDGV